MSDDSFLGGLDRYTVLRRIGAGGMGVVYQVFDRERSAVVALKMMQRYDAASLYRFKREFRTLADVKHPNLVGLYELASHNGHWYFTMEYVEGRTFLAYVREEATGDAPSSNGTVTLTSDVTSDVDPAIRGSLVCAAAPPKPAVESRLRPALAQLTHAVHALHELGHLHRDIKPSNVLVTDAGRVVLLDFGLIATVEGPGARQSVNGLMIGTPAYMSPEQTVGAPLLPASDWYSVGAIVYEALTGAFPFQPGPGVTTDLLSLIDHKRSNEVPPASTLNREIAPDLAELCGQLLRRDAAERPSGADIVRRISTGSGASPPVSATGADPARTVFVGREGQTDALRKAFETCCGGALAVVHVHGSSGIGKSALLRHFLDRDEVARQALVLEGRCYEQESLPHKALDSVVDALSQHMAVLDDRRLARMLPSSIGELARMFPVLERINAVASAAAVATRPVDPQSRRRIAFGALRELLTRLARERPLIIYIDDLQWGDVDSALAIDEILRPPDPPPLMFVGCFRSEDAETSLFLERHIRSMRQLAGSFFYSAQELGPLSAVESERLAQSLLGRGGDLTDAHPAALVREAQGHPYFMRELVRYHTSPFSSGAGSSPSVATLSDVLSRRIRHLPDNGRRVLEAISVAGHPIDQRVAIEASGVGAAAPGAVEELRNDRFIRSRSVGGRSLIEPYHDQIRQNAVLGIRAEQLRDLHGRLAVTLEASGSADPEQLALHFEAAGVLDKAAVYTEAAGDAATELLAFDWASELYSRSLKLVGDDDTRRQRLRVKAAEAFANAGRGSDSAVRFLDAAAFAESTPLRLEYQRRAAEQLLGTGRIDEGVAVLRDVLAAVGIAYPRTAKHALTGLLMRRALIRLRGVGHRERREEDLSSDVRARLDICRTAAEGLAMVDNIRGAHFQARNLLLTLASGDPNRVSLALALESGFVATAGGPGRARAEALAGRAMAIAQRTGHPYPLGRAIIARGLAHYLVGEWRPAAIDCGRAVTILRDRCIGVRWALSTAQRFEIGGLCYQGEIRQVAERVPVLLEDARRRGDLYLATELCTRDSHLALLAADDPGTAFRNIANAMGRWSHSQFHLQHYNAMLAEVHSNLYVGKTAEAWQLFSAAWGPLLKSMLMRVQVLRAEVRFLRARTMLHGAMAAGDWSALPEVRRDIARLRRERMPWCDALALLVEASIASAEGDRGRLDSTLRAAAQACSSSGMELYAACAGHVLGRVAGDEDARAAARASESFMTMQRVQRPDRIAALFLPVAVDRAGSSRH